MTEPTAMETEGPTSFSGNAGDTFQCQATLTPSRVTLPYVLWRSTNPKVATVDSNGLVTLQQYSADDLTRSEGDEEGMCKIIAESLYFNGPVAEFTIKNTDFNGVNEIYTESFGNGIDYTQPYEVYNLSGVKVGDSKDGLAKGIYIVRQGNAAVKICVK